ncbi:MAG: SIR2 family protein, partial [Beggiatoa sp.]|nr:SIR2 family protein [Beggiatoa sp.]
MFWIHGYWQRPAGIVLNSGEYNQAYKLGIYRDTFKELWVREHLAFVGFGFNDPQFTFMVGEFLPTSATRTPRRAMWPSSAFPWRRAGGSPTPRPSASSARASKPISRPCALLPRPDGDHAALQVLLEHLAERCRPAGLAFAAPPLAPAATPASTLPAKWVHETSNDEKFTGRNDDIVRLDRWVRDAAVRVLAVCAVGGTDKTALIGHWLKNTVGWRIRPFAGLFAWSFYQQRDTKEFLEAFLAWARETFRTPKANADTKLVAAALAVLRAQPLVLVLDGLEVLQEGPDDTSYGSFLDGDLRELLAALCQRDHRSMAMLTSRFVFADLDRFLGTAFHQLELHGLAPDKGARLLEELGVRGPPAEREHVSEQLDGHPLGLRVVADALPEEDRDEPRRFLDHRFHIGALPEGAFLNDKLRRLLVFYEKKLPVVQVRILGIVSLFRAPVADETVLRLVRGLFCEALPDDATLTTELQRLQSHGILTCEPIGNDQGSACHPILRDHFRAVLLGTGADTARRAAALLTGQPSAGWPRSIKEIEPVLLAT